MGQEQRIEELEREVAELRATVNRLATWAASQAAVASQFFIDEGDEVTDDDS